MNLERLGMPLLFADGSRWTDDEVTLALNLYSITPYSKITPLNPNVIRLAEFLGRKAGAVSFKLSNLASLDKEIKDSGKKGSSHISKTDVAVWAKYHSNRRLNLEKLIKDSEEIVKRLTQKNNTSTYDPNQCNYDDITEAVDTESMRLIKTRKNQSYFRKVVLANFGGKCAISNCYIEQLIDAAHILSWDKYPELRMKRSNGIALNKILHQAYDLNLLGIDSDMRVHVSSKLKGREVGDLPFRKFFESIDGYSINILNIREKPDPDYLGIKFKEYKDASF